MLHQQSFFSSGQKLATNRCRVTVVMTAPEIQDCFHARGVKLDSKDLPDGWERWSVPRAGQCSTYDTIIVSPWGKKFDRREKLRKYLEFARTSLKLPLENVSIKLPNTSHSDSSFTKARKNSKKPKSEHCDLLNTSSRSQEKSHREFFSNPRTVRERKRNMSVLLDYNQNHEDDLFEVIDTSAIPSKILLNSSSSSCDSSSPSPSRRSSPASFLPKLTREATPLQFRSVLHCKKNENKDSGNR